MEVIKSSMALVCLLALLQAGDDVVRDGRINVWIGLNDVYVEGIYRWLDNTDIQNYTNWARRYLQPSNVLYENCVHIWGNTGYHWADDNCEASHSSLCEKPADGNNNVRDQIWISGP